MKIIAVFKTHFDIGFTDLSENVRKNFCNEMLERTFEVCEATSDRPDGKRYVWTVPSEPLQYALNSEYITEENRKRLINYIENGQMVWHALPFTVHSEFCGLNELIYGLNISEKLSKRFGRKTVSAKMTDVPGHTWFIPSLLNAAGVKFLHLGCNAGSTPPDVPPLFWWEGPDGSRVLTMYAKGGYGTDVLPPEGWKYPVWLAMTMTNDNIGPQTVEFIDEMEKRVSENRPDDELVFGTMDDFYYELEPYIDDIPVIKSDLADTWIHGVGTYPKQVREIRQNRRNLAAMNNLYNLLSVIENTEYDPEFKQNCETALYNTLMFDEHTWGCDIKLYLKDRKYEKQEFLDWLKASNAQTAKLSWEEQIARVNKANEALNKVSEKLCAVVEESTDELIVYGNGSASGDYWIPVEKGAVYTDKQYGTPMTTFSGVNGDELYLPILHNTEIRSYKKGFGISACQKNVSVKRDGENIIVSTPYHTAVFSARLGTLCGLTDLKTGYNWINSEQSMYRYDIYSKNDIEAYKQAYIYHPYDWILKDLDKENYPTDHEHKCFYPALKDISVRENGESAEIKAVFVSDDESFSQYGNAETITVSFVFYGYKPQIDVECLLKNKQASPYLESGHFVLPLNNGKMDFCFDKLGCIVRPDRDILECCNNSLYCLENFVHAQADNCGITVISKDMPLFSIGDIGILKYSQKYTEPKNNFLYFNLFNNQWGTNFPQWISGDCAYRYSIITHKGNEDFGIVLGRKYNESPFVLKGKLKDESAKKLFSVSDSIKLLSFEKKDDEYYHLILKESNGKELCDTVDFRAFKEAYKSDLLGQKYEKLGDVHEETFKPHSLRCFLCKIK